MSIENIISELTDTPLNALYKEGFTPEQVKELIIKDLSPYFLDRSIVEKHSTRYLVSDWINFKRLQTKNEFTNYLSKSINFYQTAYSLNDPATIEIIAKLMDKQYESGNRFWRIINLQNDRENLPLQEFVYSIMNDMGSLIEGLLKPLLTEHLALSRLIRRKDYDVEKISSLDYGVIVNELSDVSDYPELFKIPPNNLKISDWRNIAYHHNYRIKNGLIECTYGKKDNRRQIAITKEELIEVAKKLSLTLEILNLSHKFFCYEHMNEINKFKNDQNIVFETEGRDEIWFLILASEITVQGYELLTFEYNESLTTFRLREMTNGDIKWRSALVTQFLHIVWQYTLSKKIELTYILPDNSLYLHASVTSDICEKIARGEKDIKYLAETMKVKLF